MPDGLRSHREVTTVDLLADDAEAGARCVERIGPPAEAYRRHRYLRLEPRGRPPACKAELLQRVLVPDRLVGRHPLHAKRNLRRSRRRIPRRPSRLVDDRNVAHFERRAAAIRAHRERILGNDRHPVEAVRGDGGVNIVELVLRGRRPLEERESSVGEGALTFGPACPVFALHEGVVGCDRPERDAAPAIVGAHPRKPVRPGDPALEVENVRRLLPRPRRLVQAAVFVEPRDGKWCRTTVLCVLGLGFGLFSSPIIHAIMGSVERRYVGVAAATSATMRVSGQSFSMGIAALVLAVVVGRHEITASDLAHLLSSIRITFLIFAVLCAIGVVASLVGPGRRAKTHEG